MNTSMAKSIFLTTVLIFFGLSVSASEPFTSGNDYFGGNQSHASLPSEHTAYSANMFSTSDFVSGDVVSQGTLDGASGGGWGDPDPLDPPPGGGTIDPNCGYNDCPIGNGIYVLMLLLSTYGGMLFLRRKKIIE